MKRIATLLVLMLCTGLVFAQQDAQQSQYMFNGIYVNPGYAGYKENLNLYSYYRNQWTGIPGAPRSFSVAVDASANEGNVGLALQVSSDRLGAQSTLSAYINYAYRLRMNDEGTARLAFGVGLGVMEQGVYSSQLITNDAEPVQPTSLNYIFPDGRVGIYYSDSKFYAGLSADNLISQYGDYKSHNYITQPKPHFYLTTGVLFTITEDVLLKPSILLKDDRGGPTSLDANAFVILGGRLWLGGSYRTGVKLYNKSFLQNDLPVNNAAVAAVQLFPAENFRIGYAYDLAVGPLKGYAADTHEISIGFYFKTRKSRMLTPRYF